MRAFLGILILFLVVVAFVVFSRRGKNFPLPEGETMPFAEEILGTRTEDSAENSMKPDAQTSSSSERRGAFASLSVSTREVFVTDGTKHSIPLEEILSGGVPKDGIPSINKPHFIPAREADAFLQDDSPGLGLVYDEEARFYPYQILVWHEIVNDIVAGDPLVITYCPLCATGIVFDAQVSGERMEFGVSGKLWQSNLLMYNRASDSADESLWSQVLGEAVVGRHTGTRLHLVPADTVRYGEWRAAHPETVVLSRETGVRKPYGSDPYGSYYTDDSVGFGAMFNDDRLPPKAFVLGIERDGKFKAYHKEALPEGTTTDTFSGADIVIEKNSAGEVRFFAGKERASVPAVGSFWFSWLAVHPKTELWK